jgi:hypothetical protein
MCVVRRGIDERDHRNLTGIGGCCARPSTGHALDAATLPGSVTNRAFASLASGWEGRGCSARLPSGPGGRMLSLGGTRERSMSKTGLDNRHRNHDGEISHKHGNTLIGTLRKIYGQGFAAGYPATEKLSEVLLQLNETSLSQLRRDHETGHLGHKIAKASK